MKLLKRTRSLMILLVNLVTATVLMGCNKDSQPAAQTPAVAAAEDPLGTVQFQKVFAKADPNLRVVIDELTGSIRGQDYPPALETLGRLLSNPKLSPEQKQAVQEMAERIKVAGAK